MMNLRCHLYKSALTRTFILSPLCLTVACNSSFTNLHRRAKPIIPGRALATMVKAIKVHELGGPEMCEWHQQTYFTTRRVGATWGMRREAVGVVTAVGPGLTWRKVGDLVGYAGNPMGSYTEEQILSASAVVPVPASIDPILGAAILLKGMTAQFLLRRCFKVEAGHTILVHAAAGGVGSLLCQWGNALGATVIGTVSTKEKAAQAIEDGCHHPIIYTQEKFVDRVKEITKGQGVQVVYDSVGKDTFQGSLECLASRGYMVSFGQSSGAIDPVPLSALAPKSLFLTRPSMMHYTATREELLETAGEVFANVASGVLKVHVTKTYPLSQAAKAHADLEARKTSGSVVLIPANN